MAGDPERQKTITNEQRKIAVLLTHFHNEMREIDHMTDVSQANSKKAALLIEIVEAVESFIREQYVEPSEDDKRIANAARKILEIVNQIKFGGSI